MRALLKRQTEADRDLEELGAHGVEDDRCPFSRELQLVHERLDLWVDYEPLTHKTI